MRNFFYARVSSKDQSLERQIFVAKEIKIDEEYLFIEKASGKDFKRPEYFAAKIIATIPPKQCPIMQALLIFR